MSGASLNKTWQATASGNAIQPRCASSFMMSSALRRFAAAAYLRALEFVTIGGVAGDVSNSASSAGSRGSSARRCVICLISTTFTCLTVLMVCQSTILSVDRNSFEIGGRNIRSNKMKFPADFLAPFGQPHHLHIRDRLSEIIRPERIFVHKGFYSEVFKNTLDVKAAIVHLDCDLYQSTHEVLFGLLKWNAYQDGTVLLFDDWNCNRANQITDSAKRCKEVPGSAELSRGHAVVHLHGYNGAFFILHDLAGMILEVVSLRLLFKENQLVVAGVAGLIDTNCHSFGVREGSAQVNCQYIRFTFSRSLR